MTPTRSDARAAVEIWNKLDELKRAKVAVEAEGTETLTIALLGAADLVLPRDVVVKAIAAKITELTNSLVARGFELEPEAGERAHVPV